MKRGFILPSLWLAAGSLVAGAAGGVIATRTYYLGVMARQELERREEADVATENARLAGRAYEAWKARQQPRAAESARSVQRELQKSLDWAGSPIPAGVRDALERAAAEAGASEPGAAVPPVPAASAANQ